MGPEYKLYYFNIRCRGELLRYIFRYTNTPYEEVTVSGEEWGGGLKQKMPMHTLPVLELRANGSQLSQSQAVARFLATKVGLVSSNPFENAWGDQLAGAVDDIYPVYYTGYHNAVFGTDARAKAKTLQDLIEKGFTPLFNMLEKFLGDKKLFCGQKVHWSDLLIAEHVDRAQTIFGMDMAYSYPKLAAHCKRIHENPGLKKYVEKRQPTPV